MKRTPLIFLALLVLLTGLSCQRFSLNAELDGVLESRNRPNKLQMEQEARKRALEAQVRRRFALVRELITARQFDKAEEILSTMDSLSEKRDEIAALRNLNALARDMGLSPMGMNSGSRSGVMLTTVL